MRFHTPSLAVGAALVALVGLLSAQQAVTGPTIDVRVLDPMVVRGVPTGKDMVRIPEGTPYTVPSDRLLVITGVGTLSPGIDPVVGFVNVNGASYLNVRSGGATTIDLPTGLTAPPSSIVEPVTVPNGNGPLVLLGYLADN